MGKVKSTSSEMQDLIHLAQDQGWRVEWTKNGHIKICPLDTSQPPIFLASSPSDWRAAKNIRARLKRAGLKGI